MTLTRLRRLALTLAMLGLAACGHRAPGATMTSAVEFRDALLAQLESRGAVAVVAEGRGSSGSIRTAESLYALPAAALDPQEIFGLGSSVRASWGNDAAFPTRGAGGGGYAFHVHYGSGSSHVFIDVIAYREQRAAAETHVQVLLRTVE